MDQTHETINDPALTKDPTGTVHISCYLDGIANILFSSENRKTNLHSYSFYCKPIKILTNINLSSLIGFGESENSTYHKVGVNQIYSMQFYGCSLSETKKITPSFVIKRNTHVAENEWVNLERFKISDYIKLYFNRTIVNYQCVSYRMIPLNGDIVTAGLVARDYYQTYNGDIGAIQIFYRFLASCKIMNLFKFGNKTIAQDKVHINKVCLERVTSPLRFDLKPAKKPGNSHKIWKINGPSNYVNLFEPINQITLSLVYSFNILEKNNYNWRCPNGIVYDCSFLDSIISNKVFTDDQAPSYLEPNILSVNLERPKVIMISQYNIETDHMEYLFIIGNPVNGVKKFDCEKNVILYSSDNFKFKVKPNEYLFAHSRYDNYLNTTRLSDLHSPILFLIKPLHDDRCTKKIRLNSTTVVGCTAKGSQGYIRDKKNTSIYFNKVSQDTTSHKFKLLYLNIELNKLIRATKFVRCIDTKSNMPEPILSDFYRGSIPPNVHDVSIENETNINLEYSIAPEKTVLLQHGDQNLSSWGSTFAISRETNTTHFTYHLSNTPFQSIDHSLKCHNYGNIIIDMRNNTSTINLANNNKLLAWNKPRKWKVQSFNIAYLIQKKSDSVSPIIRHTPSSFYDMPSFDLSIVRTISKTTSEFKNDPDWSKSKIILGDLVFDSSENNTTKVPGAFTPNENNVIHSKSNEKSKITESTIGTLHRLGEYIIKLNSLVRWNVKFTKEHLTPIIKPI
jgi:hypothetical protein